jgi:hypothetical protein
MMKQAHCGMAIGLLAAAAVAAEAEYAWQRDYARVTETGNIEWAPQAFRYEPGASVRYIDFEGGSDDNDGLSRERPWKHHPWDAAATGKAAGAAAFDTAVFKGGAVYRGLLAVKGQGRPGAPLRLTRDPSWGAGPAILAGSQRVTGWSRGADKAEIPEPDQVWKAALDFAPRTLWLVDAKGASRRIPLARHPNWTSQLEDHKAQWFAWTNDPHPFQRKDGFSANDSAHLKGLDADFVNGALIYSEFGWVMGTPYPSKVGTFEPATGAVKFEQWTGGGNASVIFRGMRYYLEDKPQYLDDPEGEFWFDKRGEGGTLYVRLPEGVDPNAARLEAGRLPCLITGAEARHLVISGLDFRWTTQPWALDVAMWDFSTKPWGARADATPACIRLWGRAEDVRIANCAFEDAVMGVRVGVVGDGAPVRAISIEDCAFRNLDAGAAHLWDGTGWGSSHLMGVMDDVCLYRNYATNIGFRATRYERGCAFSLKHPRRAHVAGNVIERAGAQGINIEAGKASGVRGDVPLVRVLVHQNKAWKTMQNANDFGGIESWQHGPVYIYDNLSFDARGQWEGRRVTNNGSPGFGHAYYLDGGFKNYLFNNIAWGLSNDPQSPLVNCAAFQEIHSYQNVFFNNTAYNFTVGSRRQSPHAGRNLYLGNVWQGISERVFRHADPAKTQADGNAKDAGPQKEHFAYESNGYDRNLFFDVAQLGVFEASGRWLASLDDYRQALADKQSLACGLGALDAAAPLRDPARGDFRLRAGSAGADRGAVAFVPWALYGVVAEWNFCHAGNDAAKILDDHWAAKDCLGERTDYHAQPTYPLTAVNVSQDDYESGPLENYAAGALRFSPAKKSYAALADAEIDKPYTAKLASRPKHGQDPQVQPVTFEGEALQSPEIYGGNFLIEVVFKARADGVLVQKRKGAGFALALRGGKAWFVAAGEGGATAELSSSTRLDDGAWHHVVAECDRQAKALALYVDGRRDASGAGIGAASLANAGDLTVGGAADGGWLDGSLEFVRLARGTLADACTSIGELYAWEFDGPARRDMRGAKPLGKGRDAGALECF